MNLAARLSNLVPRGARLPLASGFAATLFSIVYQSPGVVLSPDGWAYWESSVSMLEGHGYRYFGGQPAGGWPPGFPLYLAFWQALLGPRAGTLAIAHAVAIGAAVALWVASSDALLGPRSRRMSAVQAACAVALLFLVPIALREILSESLFVAFLGGALLLAVSPRATPPESRARSRLRAAFFVLLMGAMQLTRHAGVLFVPSLCWIYWRTMPRRDVRAAALAIALGVTACALWLVGRLALGDVVDHAHIEDVFSEAPRIADLLLRNLAAAAQLVAPVSMLASVATALCIVGVALSLSWFDPDGTKRRWVGESSVPRRLPIATLLAAGACAVSYARYGVAGGRFVLPVVLLFLLLLLESSDRASVPALRRLATATLFVIAMVQVARGAYWIIYSWASPPVNVGWSKRIVASCAVEPGCVLAPDEVAPPNFEWIDRAANRANERSPTAPGADARGGERAIQ